MASPDGVFSRRKLGRPGLEISSNISATNRSSWSSLAALTGALLPDPQPSGAGATSYQRRAADHDVRVLEPLWAPSVSRVSVNNPYQCAAGASIFFSATGRTSWSLLRLSRDIFIGALLCASATVCAAPGLVWPPSGGHTARVRLDGRRRSTLDGRPCPPGRGWIQ